MKKFQFDTLESESVENFTLYVVFLSAAVNTSSVNGSFFSPLCSRFDSRNKPQPRGSLVCLSKSLKTCIFLSHFVCLSQQTTMSVDGANKIPVLSVKQLLVPPGLFFPSVGGLQESRGGKEQSNKRLVNVYSCDKSRVSVPSLEEHCKCRKALRYLKH